MNPKDHFDQALIALEDARWHLRQAHTQLRAPDSSQHARVKAVLEEVHLPILEAWTGDTQPRDRHAIGRLIDLHASGILIRAAQKAVQKRGAA